MSRIAIVSRTAIVGRWLPALLLGVAAACSKKHTGADSVAAADSAMAPGAAMAPAAPAAGGAAGAAGAPVTLTVAARPGEAVYLTDANGRAVYYIASPDGKAVVDCAGECATAFDPVTGKAIVATGDTTVRVALIGDVTRPDGTTQATYAGKPLYYRHGDMGTDTKAQGMKTAGGQATLVGPDGNKSTARAGG
jgi:predicted lipoprotein with Yx(FWY)xxD motif